MNQREFESEVIEICCDEKEKIYASDESSAEFFNKSILSQIVGKINVNLNSEYKIYIVFHYLDNINEYYTFMQSRLIINNYHCIYPILHIFPIDIFSEINNCIINHWPRYYKIVDSSIWNHIIILSGDIKDIYSAFTKTIRKIVNAYMNGLYHLNISYEYADLNARLVKQSHLAKNKISHGVFVSPFLFHSEEQLSSRLEKEIMINIENNKVFQNIKWRILLVDDHANKCLSGEKNNDEWKDEEKQRKELCKTGKLQIIINDLLSVKSDHKIVWCSPSFSEIKNLINSSQQGKEKKAQFLWNKIENEVSWEKEDFNFAIMCARSVNEAQTLMKYAKFDFILLDYLLGDSTNGREYSYNLLKDIEVFYERVKRNEELNLQERQKELSFIGPNGKLYFMHISAFVTAISERLQEQSLIRDTKYWHIARGACPTNTPQLFLYYLYRLMEKRYSEMMFDEEDVTYQRHTLIDLLDAIFVTDLRHIKGNAMKYFNALLNLRRKYDIMKNDIDENEFSCEDWLNRRGSLLVYSLFPDIQYYSNSFWEHIQQLVYLTAYGTIRQWPEMWEEYIFVREVIQKAETSVKVVSKKRRGDGVKMPSEQIEQYIIHMKNA